MKNKLASLFLLAASALPSEALTTISFLTDTWRYDSGPNTTGLVNQTLPASNTTTKGYVDKDGITLTFTATFVGTAVSGGAFSGPNIAGAEGSSLTNASAPQNPPGFLLSTQSNDSPGIPDGIDTPIPTTASVTSYQRWHFEFSVPVTLNTFLMEDIDNTTNGFRDILGAEAFTSVTPGVTPTAGTGFNPTFGLGSQHSSNLLNVGAQDLLVVYPNVNTGNPASTAPVNSTVSFGSTPIQAFSIYAISNATNVHRMALDGSSFVIVVPEPSTAALGIIALSCAVLRRRR